MYSKEKSVLIQKNETQTSTKKPALLSHQYASLPLPYLLSHPDHNFSLPPWLLQAISLKYLAHELPVNKPKKSTQSFTLPVREDSNLSFSIWLFHILKLVRSISKISTLFCSPCQWGDTGLWKRVDRNWHCLKPYSLRQPSLILTYPARADVECFLAFVA